MGYFQMLSKFWAAGAPHTATPLLTLTYGLRYDFFSVPREQDDRAVMVNPQTGELLPPGTSFHRAKKDNFEPRFGLVYLLPFWDTTFFSASAGIYLGVPKTGDLLLPIESDRFSTGRTGGAFPTNPSELIRNFVEQPETRQFQPLAFTRDFTLPERAYKWQASLSRTFGTFLDLKLAYSGNIGRNLPLAGIANPIVGVETNADPTKPANVIRQFDIVRGGQIFKPFGEFFFRTSGGHSSYNALTISAQRVNAGKDPKPIWLRFKTFKAQYTLSRNVGNVTGSVVSDPSSFDSDYGYNAADARHSFSLSAVYSLADALRHKKTSLLWGWMFSSQVTARSGLPLIIRLDRPDVVYLDASGNVFSTPALDRRAVINTPGGGATGGARVPDLLSGVSPHLGDGLERPAVSAISSAARCAARLVFKLT
jgi:hypothetical protein